MEHIDNRVVLKYGVYMTVYVGSIKKQAIELRRAGYSLREISNKLNIAKSTTSLWTHGVQLSARARNRIKGIVLMGRKLSISTKMQKRRDKEKEFEQNARVTITQTSTKNIHDKKLLLALLYGCEGAKSDRFSRVTFVNSDPKLIAKFIHLFRKTYQVDEKRWRGCLHLHDYHNVNKQKKIWSRITNIPINQFTVYQKQNTKIRKREHYQGCLSLRYYNSTIAKELYYLYKEFIA